MRPLFKVKDSNIDFKLPKYYDFGLWEDIHVTPITEENTEEVTVRFPDKNGWVDYWDFVLYENVDIIENYECPLNRFPVFLKRGSIIPMNVSTDDSHYGTAKSSGYLTVVVPFPKVGDKREG